MMKFLVTQQVLSHTNVKNLTQSKFRIEFINSVSTQNVWVSINRRISTLDKLSLNEI